MDAEPAEILLVDYGQHFSLGIICDLIGVAPDDRETIKPLSDDTVSMYEPGVSEAQQAIANRAAGDLRRCLLDVVCYRRARPGSDLMTALIDATVDGERLDDGQIVSTAMVLLMAGHEATVNATSNGVAALAAHPAEWRRIRSGEVPVPAGDRGDPGLGPAPPMVRALGPRRRRRARRRPGREGLARGAGDRRG